MIWRWLGWLRRFFDKDYDDLIRQYDASYKRVIWAIRYGVPQDVLADALEEFNDLVHKVREAEGLPPYRRNRSAPSQTT